MTTRNERRRARREETRDHNDAILAKWEKVARKVLEDIDEPQRAQYLAFHQEFWAIVEKQGNPHPFSLLLVLGVLAGGAAATFVCQNDAADAPERSDLLGLMMGGFGLGFADTVTAHKPTAN